MIEVIVRRTDNDIREVTLSGHAYAAEPGSDIVCAAVSAVSLGTLNAVHLLIGITPEVQQAERGGGFLRWSVSPLQDEKLHEKQQLLAEGMVIALLAIAEQYGEYVQVQDQKWQGGVS